MEVAIDHEFLNNNLSITETNPCTQDEMSTENRNLKEQIYFLQEELSLTHALKDQMFEDIEALGKEVEDGNEETIHQRLLKYQYNDLKSKKELVENTNQMITLLREYKRVCTELDEYKKQKEDGNDQKRFDYMYINPILVKEKSPSLMDNFASISDNPDNISIPRDLYNKLEEEYKETKTELDDCYELLENQMTKLRELADENMKMQEMYGNSLTQMKELYTYNSNITELLSNSQTTYEATHRTNSTNMVKINTMYELFNRYFQIDDKDEDKAKDEGDDYPIDDKVDIMITTFKSKIIDEVD